VTPITIPSSGRGKAGRACGARDVCDEGFANARSKRVFTTSPSLRRLRDGPSRPCPSPRAGERAAATRERIVPWRQNPQQSGADPSHTSSTTVVPRPEKPSGASATVTYEYISSCETERARGGGGWRRSAWLPRRRENGSASCASAQPWGAGGVPRRPRRRCACGRSARGCGGEPVVSTAQAASGENPRSFGGRRGYRKRAGRGEDARCGCP